MFNIKTDIREILTHDHQLQHYEAVHLNSEHFKLEKGVWVRRWALDTRTFGAVYETPTCRPRR